MFGDSIIAYWKENNITPYSWEVKTYRMDYFTNVKYAINMLCVIYPDSMPSVEVNRINEALCPMYDVVVRISNHVCYALPAEAELYRLYTEYRDTSMNKCQRVIHNYNECLHKGDLNHFKEVYGTVSLNDLLSGVMVGIGSILRDKVNNM